MTCRECDAILPDEARFCLSCGARVERTAPAPRADPLLDALDKAIGFQYRIERLLGRGGMGAVYLAHELALDRDVAIKVLPPEQAITPELRERFKREARTAARLTHPHIVPLHTFGEVSGLMYFVMGYVAGESLAARLRRDGPLESEAARNLLASLCDALDYAHQQGIVHRDIKPDNVLIDEKTGAPLLMDFGIAKAAMADAQLTTAGQLMGTPHYMSPEQAMGRADVGPRSDLYSLGVVAYEMVSGRRPFEGRTAMEALAQRLTHEPRPLTAIAREVAPDLAEAIGRCLQREPADRWPDAKSLREALLPTEDESENTFEERMLRICASMVLLTLLAAGYMALYAAFNPGVLLSKHLIGLLVGSSAAVTVLGCVAAVRIRSQRLEGSSVLRGALQQPLWWRGWYPRALRRRGDLWDRLPRELRLFRAYRGACLVYIFTVFLPVQLMTLTGRDMPTVRRTLFVLTFAAIAGMVAVRRRAMERIKTTLTATEADASRLLNTATWRTSVWRRAPTASLLGGAAPAPNVATSEPPTAEAVDDVRTRVSSRHA